jgi:tetratricopeptide (TPR) repeat protein
MDGFERASSEHAAIALMRAGNHRGAEARLRTMLAANPNDARAMALLARCRLEEDGKLDRKEALEIARSAVRLNPDDPLVRSTLTYALQKAGKGRSARAEQLQLAEDAANESPDDSDALFNLAVARLNSDQYRKANGRKQMDQFVVARDLLDDAERFAGEAHELLNVAYLRLDQWNYEAAASLAQRAMQLDPTRPEAFRILAECALARKQPLNAYELALEALRLAPGDKEIMRVMIRARARRNVLLRPFLTGVDWMVEMDRRGLVILPLLTVVLAGMFAIALSRDIGRANAGEAPAVVVALPLGLALFYVLVSYLTAIFMRAQIRRDLRRVALPDF